MAISTITENHVRSGQVCSKNCDLTKTIAILTAIAIPIITTVFAYVGAFNFLKLQVINPKFTFALKIIVPATLGFGIVLTEIFIFVCIFSANKKQNNLPSNDEFQALDSSEIEDKKNIESEEEKEICECEDEREFYEYADGFISLLSWEIIKSIPKNHRIYKNLHIIFIRQGSIMRGIFEDNTSSSFPGPIRGTYIAMKLDMFDLYEMDHVATITETLYQYPSPNRRIQCHNPCYLENPKKGERPKFVPIRSILSGGNCLKHSGPNRHLSYNGAGLDDIRNLINGEDVLIRCGMPRKELNPIYYSEDFNGKEPLFILRLHKETFEKKDEEERFRFMLEIAQFDNRFLINLNIENFDNLFLFRFLILELNS